ncbi:hypothetical protein GDO78_019474 [Eleutherodactylus coqui]|uniref:Uncharacterized protein n=1 Tax=Eleutherodactylus coqui TaxID=57060 RepID=A0A8J6EAR0_ELECQ|nr:hypothetical protein GDO78_019474 [Eleutherodactylus coqui]
MVSSVHLLKLLQRQREAVLHNGRSGARLLDALWRKQLTDFTERLHRFSTAHPSPSGPSSSPHLYRSHQRWRLYTSTVIWGSSSSVLSSGTDCLSSMLYTAALHKPKDGCAQTTGFFEMHFN